VKLLFGAILFIGIFAYAADEDAPNTKASTDCKSWQDFHVYERALRTNNQNLKLDNIYYKDEDSIGHVSEAKQSLISVNEKQTFYLKVADRAILFLTGKGLVYRPVNGEKIHKSIVGLMQSIALLGDQLIGDNWNFEVNEGKLQLSVLLKDKPDALKDSYILFCTNEKICFLKFDKKRDPQKLEKNSPEHKQLKTLGIFDDARLQAFDEACDLIAKKSFIDDFDSDLNQFSKACGPVNGKPDLEQLKLGCAQWKKTLRPVLKSFQ
jgi:hypothetical protein